MDGCRVRCGLLLPAGHFCSLVDCGGGIRRAIQRRDVQLASPVTARSSGNILPLTWLHQLRAGSAATTATKLMHRKPLTMAQRIRIRRASCIICHVRSASTVRGWPAEQYRSCADTRSSARSDRSNELQQTLPGRDAWSACHYAR